jgi:hypothetical protein
MKKIFRSPFFIAVFTAVFLASLFIVPQHILTGEFFLLGVVFITLFSLNIACLVDVMRQRAKVARAKGSGIVGIVATAVGFIALQMCGVGGPLCGAFFGSIVFASVLPAGALHYFTGYAVYIVLAAIAMQVLSLYLMKCWK